MKDYLTLNKNMLGATTSGTSFNVSRSGSSKLTSHASTPSGSSILKPGEFVRRSTSDGRTAYYRDGKEYTYEEYQAEIKRQEEERKRQEEEQKRQANNNTSHSSGGHDGHVNSEDRRYQIQAEHIKAEKERAEQAATGGNYSFNLDDDNVRNLINNSEDSEDDNTLLYAILAGIGIVGVAFAVKKSKNKNKKKKK